MKHFAGTFRPAQTLKLGGVYIHIFSSLPKAQKTYVFEHILVCVTYCIDENRHSKQDIWPCINNLSSALTNVYYICNILHKNTCTTCSHVRSSKKKKKKSDKRRPFLTTKRIWVICLVSTATQNNLNFLTNLNFPPKQKSPF